MSRTEELVQKIYELAVKNEVWFDLRIYFEGKCWTDKDGYGGKEIAPGKFLIEDIDPTTYFDYVNEEDLDSISMSFEGPMYHCFNYGLGRFVVEFQELLEEYGWAYELGNAWNLTTYRI